MGPLRLRLIFQNGTFCSEVYRKYFGKTGTLAFKDLISKDRGQFTLRVKTGDAWSIMILVVYPKGVLHKRKEKRTIFRILLHEGDLVSKAYLYAMIFLDGNFKAYSPGE